MVEFQLLSGILTKKGGDFDPADIFTGNMMGTGFEQKNPVAVFQFWDAEVPARYRSKLPLWCARIMLKLVKGISWGIQGAILPNT